jgi:cell division septum initiation protein DivIVA
MIEFNGINGVSIKNSIGRASSKAQVTIETTSAPKSALSSEIPKEIKNLEQKVAQADYAYQLMMEIKKDLETAYKTLSQDKN